MTYKYVSLRSAAEVASIQTEENVEGRFTIWTINVSSNKPQKITIPFMFWPRFQENSPLCDER